MFDFDKLQSPIPSGIAAQLQQPGVTWRGVPDEHGRGFSPVAYDAKGAHIVTLDYLFPDAGKAIDYIWFMTGRQ